MAGPNTSGTANPQDYIVGRGILFAAPIKSDGLPGAFRDLGNAPAFTVTSDSETLEHFSSRAGLRVLDNEVTLSRSITVGFTLEEFNDENLAFFFSGDKATPTNGAIAGFTSYEMIAASEHKSGRTYEIRNSAGVRAYDVNAADVTVGSLTLNTDYTIDEEMGLITFLATSAVTALDGATAVDVTLAAKAGASVVNEVRAFTQSVVEVAIKFISENAVNNQRSEIQFHRVKLKADGDLGLIGDDWGAMQFTGAAESNADADADSPTCRIRTVAA